MIPGVNKQVLWLDIAVAITKSMDVCEGSETLIRIELDQNERHLLPLLVVVLQNTVDSLRHVVHDHV